MKSNSRTKRCWMLRKLPALMIAVVLVLTSLTSVVAKEVDKVESVKLFVKFKSGASTLRKGSNGLKEVEFYETELIKSVKLYIASQTSGDIVDSKTINKILEYVKVGDFDAAPPVEMVPTKKERVYPNSTTMTYNFRDGHQKVYRGYEIKNSPKADPLLVESTVLDNGNGNINKLIYAKSQNYIIAEGYRLGKPVIVMLHTAKNYVPIGGTIIVTRKDGYIERFDGVEIDKVKKINPTTIQKIEIHEVPMLADSTEVQTASKRVDFYDLSREQVALINRADFKYGDTVAYRRSDCTEVDYIVPIFYSKQWFSNSSQTYIVDPKSGEKYQLQSIARGVPIDRYIRVINQVGKCVLFTLIFPPLPEDVKSIDILSYKIQGQPTPAKANGSGPWLTKNIKLLDDIEREYKEL